MYKHISLLEFCEHCYMSYLESCPIGQVPKIMSPLGAKIKLFLNGILEAAWWPLGPYFKVSNSLTEWTDFYHSLPEKCSWVCCDMQRLCLASGLQWGLSCDMIGSILRLHQDDDLSRPILSQGFCSVLSKYNQQGYSTEPTRRAVGARSVDQSWA